MHYCESILTLLLQMAICRPALARSGSITIADPRKLSVCRTGLN